MKNILIFLFFIMQSYNVLAHSSHEISYLVDKKGSMTIHITPLAAYDLLEKKMKIGTIVNFNEHKSYFQSYINENTNMIINKQKQNITVDSLKIGEHDSKIFCHLSNFPSPVESFSIESTAFYSLYTEAINVFEIPVDQDIKVCKLSLRDKHCSYQSSSKKAKSFQYLYLWIIPILLLAAYFMYKRE